MEESRLIETFPEVVVAMSELGDTLVTFCHDPDLRQMQSNLSTVLAKGLVDAPFVSSSDENAKAQEVFVREGILSMMAQLHDPSKEIMLSNFHRLSEITPGEVMSIARAQDRDASEAT